MVPVAPIVVSTIGMPSLFPMRHDDLESHRADRLFSPCRPVAQPTSRGRTDSPNRGSGNCSNCRIRRHHCRRSSKQLSSLTRCDLFIFFQCLIPVFPVLDVRLSVNCLPM